MTNHGQGDDTSPAPGEVRNPGVSDRGLRAPHTDIPPRSEVERMLTVRVPGCVSIYPPTSVIRQDAQADRIALKNLAATATRQLDASGVAPTAIASVRDGLGDLVDDDDIWAAQARASPSSPRPGGPGRSARSTRCSPTST
jgi:hypothetical protein